jgi:acetolactate synthase-1/2/3 large subunit
VLIDLPKDVQQAATDFHPPDNGLELPGYRPDEQGDPELVRRAAEVVNQAERPVILAGQGVLMSGATDALRRFAEKTQIPIALTLLGKGGLPESHPLALGMMGMHGEAYVNRAIQEADLLLAFGMRFDDRVTGTLESYAPNARKIHVDLDAAELNKIVSVDVPIQGDLREVLHQLLPLVDSEERPAWLAQIDRWRSDTATRDVLNRAENGRLLAPHVINTIYEATGGDAILVTDVGQHQMWAAQYYPLDDPNTLVTSGGLGTMGFGLPAAIGAQLARPEREVWAVVGDGGFQMTLHELATAVQEQLPIRIAICNNGYLGMVRQWQEMFYDERYESTRLLNPDFVKLAEAYGVRSWRATRPDEARAAVAEARAHPGPALIDFQVAQEGEEGNVYPMVPAGAALHDMIRRPVMMGQAVREE